MHKTLLALALALVAVNTGCGPGTDPRLDPLAEATLRVGHGLGDLILEETTLGQVLDRYGAGQVALFAGDEAAFELALAGGQLDLLFRVPDEWYLDGAPLREAVHDLPTFVAANPEYRELPLGSLSVRDRGYGGLFYRGALEHGGRLRGPIDEVLSGYGPPADGPGPFVAGMSPSNPDERALYLNLGLLVYYRTPEYGEEPPAEREPPTIESIVLFSVGDA